MAVVYTNFFGGPFFGGGFFGAGTETQITGGGYNPSQGYSGYETRTRTKEEVRRQREELGIIPRRVIEEVAVRQVERLEVDQQKQFEELSRELHIQGIEFDRRYLDALNATREILLAEEISRRLRMNINNEATMTLIAMAASA